MTSQPNTQTFNTHGTPGRAEETEEAEERKEEGVRGLGGAKSKAKPRVHAEAAEEHLEDIEEKLTCGIGTGAATHGDKIASCGM